MNFTALKKAANSSKVLLFLIFAAAITAALKFDLVAVEWYQSTIANAFYMLMGGYSIVEAARAISSSKISLAKLLEDPKAALDEARGEDK